MKVTEMKAGFDPLSMIKQSETARPKKSQQTEEKKEQEEVAEERQEVEENHRHPRAGEVLGRPDDYGDEHDHEGNANNQDSKESLPNAVLRVPKLAIEVFALD